jgi:hypothetical protein
VSIGRWPASSVPLLDTGGIVGAMDLPRSPGRVRPFIDDMTFGAVAKG